MTAAIFMSTAIFNCLFSWFGSEATRIRRFLLSPWLVWWRRKTYINIVNCLFCSLVVKQHIYNILNGLFSWYGGQWTHLEITLTVYFTGMVVNEHVYKHFKVSIWLVWWSINASTNIFNCRFRCHHGEATLLHTILILYFLCLHAEARSLRPFSTAIFLVWAEATRIRRFFLSPWLVWWWRKMYIHIVNCLCFSSGGETTHLQHFKRLFCWYGGQSTRLQIVFNCLFSCYDGQPTRI